ncbi:MAG: tRNA (adenosine(37)-N6)-threonylcarbamoyltransferase complex ATPase subunit type 1 TsaE [Alphaproteobacteria bacterium]|nr:tRNA (adenosine(37)-N6)-threonylcarbamoyltransferase complex ATPase subunit type 1 TsaE [Alphaproteobacteria bacterium]
MLPSPSIRELALPDEAATAALAGHLARTARPRDVLALWGDLGAGKTTLARAFVAARAGVAVEVPSPTFTLVQTYDLPGGPVWHFDLYRLTDPEDVWELGWEEALAEAIVLVEWPIRLGPFLPDDRLDVRLSQGSADGARVARLEGHGSWHDRLEAAFV